ncbi:MAG: exodeoxyribonuclease VII large subunit [Desulfofustis sp.]|nr:exodeoxyribonuclease VII large subunit [Desulfofustis sp.]
MPARDVKTVSELTRDISQLLEGRYRFVRVAGEISGLRRPFSGHYYFVLKDASSQIKAVLFKNQQGYLSQQPGDGQQVICDGRITVYEPRGEYQIIVDTIDFHGTGHLQIAFERLKQRLKEQGLFDPAGKRPIPRFIEQIVLITSPTGAAVHDFLTVCRKRKASLQVRILPVRVQGEGASRDISGAIDLAHQLHPDVIVLCRGGGSIEDLWAFNEEEVARAIHRASIPIVTGIGHETDFTIADFCSDLRGATPTGAAELLVTDGTVLSRQVSGLCTRLQRTFAWQIDSIGSRLERLNRFLSTFDTAFSQPTLHLDRALSKLMESMLLRLERTQNRSEELVNRLRHNSPIHAIGSYQSRLEQLQDALKFRGRQCLDSKLNALQKAAAVLDSLSPLATLARGYSIVTTIPVPGQESILVTDEQQVAKDERIAITLHRGRLEAQVIANYRTADKPDDDGENG